MAPGSAVTPLHVSAGAMKRFHILLPLALLAGLVSIVVGVSVGVDLGRGEVLRVLGHHLSFGAWWTPEATADRIVWQLRMPRVLLALLVGGGLSIIGAAMQTLVRNPLAEPYILGISSGASAGASLFYLGFLPPLISKALSMPMAAFLGGLMAISIVYVVARTQGPRLSVARLLLAGVAMAALMASITSFITLSSPDPDKLRAVLFWLLGSLHTATWSALPLPAIVTLLGLFAMLVLARPLDAMLMGDEPAANLGVPVEVIKRILILLAALVTGVLVAVSGAIGFVGLIIPHAVRSIVGVTHRRLLPVCFVAGALFLLWADLVARALLPSEQLPVGIITAICGVPFFLFLLRRNEYGYG